MYKFKKIGWVLTSKSVGAGPSSYEKRIYRAAVSQKLRDIALDQCFSTAGSRPGTRPWHQLYRAARGSLGICHFSFLSNFHE